MNKVYTAFFQDNVLAGGGGGVTNFQIDIENRTALLKSILFDIKIAETAAPAAILPLELNNTQSFHLQVIALPAGTPFANIFSSIGGLPALQQNGTQLNIYKPGQSVFQSFFIRNNLLLSWAYVNRDPLTNYSYGASVCVEIEMI